MKVVVVGAGLAGLACATRLSALGCDVQVLEAGSRAGGRVATEYQDGFTLDRGFQVLFDAYPMAQKYLDLPALNLQRFARGAMVCHGARRSSLLDPRDAGRCSVSQILSPMVLTPGDCAAFARLGSALLAHTEVDAQPGAATIHEALQQHGFSDSLINTFFRPFFAGITLDPSLRSSASLLYFYLRMLVTGSAALPAEGMAAIPQQMARRLESTNSISYGVRVGQIIRSDGRVAGVRSESADYPADCVVVAVDEPAAARLLGTDPPPTGRAVSVVYFTGSTPVWPGALLALNGNAHGVVVNAQMLTNVAPSYAPKGHTLLGASILGTPETPGIEKNVMADLRTLFQGDASALDALAGYEHLATFHVGYAQPARQPVYPQTLRPEPGLLLAGDWTASGSINGALWSGHRAASLIEQMQ